MQTLLLDVSLLYHSLPLSHSLEYHEVSQKLGVGVQFTLISTMGTGIMCAPSRQNSKTDYVYYKFFSLPLGRKIITD